MTTWLGTLSAAVEGAPAVALGASALLGALSVAVSPCHLAGIPLVMGVIQARRAADRSAVAVAFRFGLGLLLSFVVVGAATVAAGRIAGDLGLAGSLLGAALFIGFGLQLLEVIDLPWFGSLMGHALGRAGAPALVGFLFGASLGPCTFSFMAPALGVVMAVGVSRPLYATGLLLVFAVTHTATVLAAGAFGGATGRFLESRGANRAVGLFRRGTGLALILGGLYFLYSAP